MFPNKIVNKFQDKNVPQFPDSKKNKSALLFQDNNVILYLKNNAELCQSKQKGNFLSFGLALGQNGAHFGLKNLILSTRRHFLSRY